MIRKLRCRRYCLHALSEELGPHSIPGGNYSAPQFPLHRPCKDPRAFVNKTLPGRGAGRAGDAHAQQAGVCELKFFSPVLHARNCSAALSSKKARGMAARGKPDPDKRAHVSFAVFTTEAEAFVCAATGGGPDAARVSASGKGGSVGKPRRMRPPLQTTAACLRGFSPTFLSSLCLL